MSSGTRLIRQIGAGGGHRGHGGFYTGTHREQGGYRDSPGVLSDVPDGFTPYGERLSAEEQAKRRQKRLNRGQLDYSIDSPLLMVVMLERQCNRRRGFAGTLLTGGLGLDEESGRRKTLLGG